MPLIPFTCVLVGNSPRRASVIINSRELVKFVSPEEFASSFSGDRFRSLLSFNLCASVSPWYYFACFIRVVSVIRACVPR
jgi:hypothetical protein